ncbi:MAG: ATP-binding protein [Candidatus Woesearchaeota archaeon]
MKFVNREEELQKLEEYHALSRKRLFMLAISGLRRVGKTTLVKEFIKGKDAIYFFVYEAKTSEELLAEFSEELRARGIISDMEKLDTWNLFFRVIFERCRNRTIIFDEFQNFWGVDKSVFSIMQRYCDEHRSSPILIIILGSLISLFKKIFEDKKHPLYGRVAGKIGLKPLSFNSCTKLLKTMHYKNKEEILKIYGIFGGFPKYYASIEQFGLENMKLFEIIEYLFIQENAPLEAEVPDLLKQEFGRRSALYYSILHAIASGKNRLSEIAARLKMKESSITRHLAELESRFQLIASVVPLGNKKSTRYSIAHPLVKFWFRFVYGKFSKYSIKDVKGMMENINNSFNSFFGKEFEKLSMEFILRSRLPFKIDYINNWWGSARLNGERKEIEIDIIALNHKSKEMMFVECKWKHNVDANKVLKELREKSRFVKWNREKEYFCIIAKSFGKKAIAKNVLLFDLDDFFKKPL